MNIFVYLSYLFETTRDIVLQNVLRHRCNPLNVKKKNEMNILISKSLSDMNHAEKMMTIKRMPASSHPFVCYEQEEQNQNSFRLNSRIDFSTHMAKSTRLTSK